MTTPTPTVAQPPAPALPRVIAALVTLLAETADVPQLAGLHGAHARWNMDAHGLAVRVFKESEPHAFLRAFADRYGSTVRCTAIALTGDQVLYEATATVDGVPVSVYAPVGGRSIESRLRRKVAELEARLDGVPATPGELAEQRHQLLDPAAPPPAVYVPPFDDEADAEQPGIAAAAAGAGSVIAAAVGGGK